MKRKITEKLVEWKRDKGHDGKALLLSGARQIGKSYAIREFGKREYKHYAEINLYENSDARAALERAQTLPDFLNRLALFCSGLPDKGDTLVFIDEIQESPDIMTMLKFLVEDGRYDYAFSGSMLGLDFKGVRSYPVGYVKELVMRPMDFEEFCWAIQISSPTLSAIEESFESLSPVDEHVHEAMLRNFRTYVVTGGMPEVVQRFIDAGYNLAPVRSLQADLVRQYEHDIMKYAGSRALHVRDIFAQLPFQLDGNKRRFLVNAINPHARFERYRKDFVWLTNAGVALKTDLATDPKAELARSRQESKFKLYQSDTGMLLSRYVEAVARAVYLDDKKANLGGVYENVVAQELAAAGAELFYYQYSSEGEVDFVVETQDGNVVPVEVKSGRSPKRHAALDHLMESQEYDIPYGVVFSRLNVETDEQKRVRYLPFYMTMCLGPMVNGDVGEPFIMEPERV